MSTMDEWVFPRKSDDTSRPSSQAMIPFSALPAALLSACRRASVSVFRFSSAVKSTIETVGVGTRSE